MRLKIHYNAVNNLVLELDRSGQPKELILETTERDLDRGLKDITQLLEPWVPEGVLVNMLLKLQGLKMAGHAVWHGFSFKIDIGGTDHV